MMNLVILSTKPQRWWSAHNQSLIYLPVMTSTACISELQHRTGWHVALLHWAEAPYLFWVEYFDQESCLACRRPLMWLCTNLKDKCNKERKKVRASRFWDATPNIMQWNVSLAAQPHFTRSPNCSRGVSFFQLLHNNNVLDYRFDLVREELYPSHNTDRTHPDASWGTAVVKPLELS